MSAPSVLFVCLGNICRSPLAEAALRGEAQAAGLEVQVDSAGTGDWRVGRPPDPRAQATARRHGIDISGYAARQATASDFERFTHIYALDAQNLIDLEQLRGATATGSLGLLMDEVPGREGSDVVDPYFGEDEGFEATWDDVTRAARAIIAKLAGGDAST